MPGFKNTVLSAAALLALSCNVARAQSTAELKQEIDALRKEVQRLSEQVKATGKPAVAADADAATRDANTSATQADIQGVRADFENYKYENARQLERKVPSVTRNTAIGGTVQVRGTWQNPAQNAGAANGATGGNTSYQATPRHTSFDIPSVTLSFAGNLFRDYKEGKNLTYLLGLASGSNFAGSPQSAAAPTARWAWPRPTAASST